MSNIIKIEIWTGEEIRIEADGQAQLFRDGALIVAPRFANIEAAKTWADKIVERAARISPRAVCINCGD